MNPAALLRITGIGEWNAPEASPVSCTLLASLMRQTWFQLWSGSIATTVLLECFNAQVEVNPKDLLQPERMKYQQTPSLGEEYLYVEVTHRMLRVLANVVFDLVPPVASQWSAQ